MTSAIPLGVPLGRVATAKHLRASRTFRLAAVFVVFVMALAGACGGEDGPPGWKRHVAEGFEVWLPEGFEGQPGFDENDLRLMRRGVRMFGLDVDIESAEQFQDLIWGAGHRSIRLVVVQAWRYKTGRPRPNDLQIYDFLNAFGNANQAETVEVAVIQAGGIRIGRAVQVTPLLSSSISWLTYLVPAKGDLVWLIIFQAPTIRFAEWLPTFKEAARTLVLDDIAIGSLLPEAP